MARGASPRLRPDYVPIGQGAIRMEAEDRADGSQHDGQSQTVSKESS